MKHQRKFIIRVDSTPPSQMFVGFVKKIYKNNIGYYCTLTWEEDNSQTWKYKKSCENKIKALKNNLDPTKYKLTSYNYEIMEITNKTILRNIKLKKLNKK